MIKVTQSGNFNSAEKFLKKNRDTIILSVLNKYGALGVRSLAVGTPTSTGATAESWFYQIEKKNEQYLLSWHNTHMAGGIPVVILLQYGHATRNGGYVQGIDFINPAIRPVMEQIATDAWKEITRV